ncbi:MAG: hypothetical protein KF766_11325 [Rhodocyclaceae bacterium]|nr:hypothetical protein [Rhodocyclaceae bacterium]
MAEAGVDAEVVLAATRARGLSGEPSLDAVAALSKTYGPKTVDELIELGATTAAPPATSADPLVELCAAIRRRDASAVRAALQAKPDVNAMCIGSRPLHLAVQTGELSVVILLIESGAATDRPDAAGSLPLDFATASAGPFTRIPENGGFRGHPDVRQYLLSHGAQLSQNGIAQKRSSDQLQQLLDTMESNRIAREQARRQARIDAEGDRQRVQRNVALLAGLAGAVASAKGGTGAYLAPAATSLPISPQTPNSPGNPAIEAFKGSITLCSHANGACMGGARFFDYVHVKAGTVEAHVIPQDRDDASFTYTVRFSNRTACKANIGSTIMQHGDTLNAQTLDFGNIELEAGQARESSSRRFTLSRSQSEKGVPVEFRFSGSVYACG